MPSGHKGREIEKVQNTSKVLLHCITFGTNTISICALAFLKKYGKGVYVCWLQDSICGTSIASKIVTKFLMWYLWSILVWLFAVIVFAVTFYRDCVHRRNAITKWNTDVHVNVSTIISLLTLYFVEVVVTALLLVSQSSFHSYILGAVTIPLMLMILFSILIIRQVSIVRAGCRRSATHIINSVVTYHSYGVHQPKSQSSTIFIPSKDRWDEED